MTIGGSIRGSLFKANLYTGKTCFNRIFQIPSLSFFFLPCFVIFALKYAAVSWFSLRQIVLKSDFFFFKKTGPSYGNVWIRLCWRLVSSISTHGRWSCTAWMPNYAMGRESLDIHMYLQMFHGNVFTGTRRQDPFLKQYFPNLPYTFIWIIWDIVISAPVYSNIK